MTSRLVRAAAACIGAALIVVPPHLLAQNDRDRDGGRDGTHSLDIGVNGVGLSIGDSRRWTGLRINYRDSRLEQANGVNLTLWDPYERGAGRVNGLAIGLPLTGASDLKGVGVGVFGFGVEHEFTGIGVGGIGMGGGGDLKGIMIAGVGMGGGGDITGISIAGVGVGGQDIKGIVLTPGVFRVERGGRSQGVAIAGYSQNKGRQDGWTIGVVNYARDLRGVQIGLINIARSNPKGTRVLPIFNANFGR